MSHPVEENGHRPAIGRFQVVAAILVDKGHMRTIQRIHPARFGKTSLLRPGLQQGARSRYGPLVMANCQWTTDNVQH